MKLKLNFGYHINSNILGAVFIEIKVIRFFFCINIRMFIYNKRGDEYQQAAGQDFRFGQLYGGGAGFGGGRQQQHRRAAR
jgi:hypothetical protein